MQRTAWGIFLLAIVHGMGAAEFLVPDNTAEMLAMVGKILGVGVILIVAPGFYQAMKLGGFRKLECDHQEGFVTEMLSKASTMAFSLTFVCLLALKVIAEKYASGLPAAFFLNVALTLSLLSFSISFFVLNRDPGEDDEFSAEDDA
ncbi:MAG: hypothetical protein HWE08_14685 [Alphaproteobacteria bacterium]|nr:hypothetical protein [Alphaproteobacteria bacterium]